MEGTTKVLIGNALKRKVHGNPLNANWQKKEFQELWRRINHKYAYTVSFDDDELVKNAVKSIDERLVVSKLSYTVTRGIQKENASRDELADRTHFHRNDSHTGDLDVDASSRVVVRHAFSRTFGRTGSSCSGTIQSSSLRGSAV